jgi:endonuclease/exonuclease/phosphatase family metal-dependent hydrolase
MLGEPAAAGTSLIGTWESFIMTLRVMTFNIRGAVPHRDGPNAWEHRAPLTLSLIERTTPDLIGFQELMSRNLETYQKHLSTYRWVLGPPTMEETGKNYNAIFWKPSSLELLTSGGFWLSPTPEQWSGGWGSASVRAATWAHFHVWETNRAFCHLNVHLDSVSEQARQQGCLLILEQLASLHLDHLPVVLTGDFNVPADVPDAQLLSLDSTITNACYRLLLDRGFVDTYHAAGKQEKRTALTYHAFEGERFLPACRCDWILARNETCSFTVHSCEILRDAAPPIYPSDHYPVLTELVLISQLESQKVKRLMGNLTACLAVQRGESIPTTRLRTSSLATTDVTKRGVAMPRQDVQRFPGDIVPIPDA